MRISDCSSDVCSSDLEEGDDDRRQPAVLQQSLEAEGAHAGNHDVVILGIAPTAPADAALGRVLVQRLKKDGHKVGRWRVAPLAGLVHEGPLGLQEEAERLAAAIGGGKLLLSREYGTEARHSLDALVG